jgi:amidohydrolase
MTVRTLAEECKEQLIAWRREIHAQPEVAWEETKTSDRVAELLASFGIETVRIAGTGVLGILHGNKPGKTVALRADMDALAITEETDSPYKSKNVGVMHACGHDGHSAMLLGAAKILSQMKNEVCGSVKFIFQPAEEIGLGALKMLEAGVMADVDAILGIHLWPDLPSGKVSLAAGPRMASADKLKITVRGKSSHGSMPHQGVDAILAAAAIIMNLQSVSSREIAPLEPAVISIGKLAGGTGWNITCGEVTLEGTTRCFSHEVRKNFPLAIERIISNTAATFRAQADMEYIAIAPPLINEPRIAKLAAASLCKLYGDNVLGDIEKVMGGEDFAFFSEKTPGAMAFIGIGNKAKQTDYPLHSNKFNIDEDVLPIGAALHAQFALDFLQDKA